MKDQPVVIRLELHVEDESLTGRASDGTGGVREFAGWMGMVAAVDAILCRRPPADPGHHPIRAPNDELG